jgi:hypothetical protein
MQTLFDDRPEHIASRHEPQIVVARAVPADPYTAWREQRETESGSAGVAAPTTRRFTRGRTAKAPWEAITVRLVADSR